MGITKAALWELREIKSKLQSDINFLQGKNMNKFSKYISSQFKNPRGIGGVIITMIQNVVNQAMYKNAVSMINLQSDENILDIGYGNGHLLEMI